MPQALAPLELAWDVKCEAGESPVWDSSSQKVYFADLAGRRVHAYGVNDGSRQSWLLPDAIGSFGLCDSGRLIVALTRRIVFFDPRSGGIEEFTGDVIEPSLNKFNDGKVGPDKCFWLGSMSLASPRLPTGLLYRVTPDGKVELKSEGYMLSNGLAWSADGATMYHSDTDMAMIEAWDFDKETGGLSNWRRIFKFGAADGGPDGAACDMDGCYWSANPRNGSLMKFSPSGELLLRIFLPIPTPTMLCFAGPAIYITSIRRNRSEEILKKYPTLGGLFRMPAPAVGVEVARFADG